MAIDREATLKTAEKLLRQGKLDGAIQEYLRLVEDQPRDWNSINVLGDLYVRSGNLELAVAQFTRIADHLYTEGFLPKAAALYKKALKIRSDDEHALLRLSEIATQQEILADAKLYLRQLITLRQGRGDERGAAECVVRLGALDPSDAEGKLGAARAAQAIGDLSTASRLFGEAAEAFKKGNRLDESLAALQSAAELAPDLSQARHVPALITLLEVAVEAGRDDVTRQAQVQLADAYLATNRGAEARAIAEDLFAQEPTSEEHAARLRRALELAGVEDVERVLDLYRDADPVFEPRPESPAVPEPEGAAPEPAAAPTPAPADHDVFVIGAVEVDLSDAIASLSPPVQASHDLEAVFEEMRLRVAREQQASDAGAIYTRALTRLEAGYLGDALVDLQAAAQAPQLRFKAASRLGRLFAGQGDLQRGIEWLERAADAPAPSVDEGRAVACDLADALQRTGDVARALAILMELDADAGEYRDVRERINALARVQAGSRDA